MMRKYHEIDVLKNIYLEDSFVIGIEESDGELSFVLEMVLMERHPLFTLVKPGEQYCYKTGRIIFSNLESIEWLSRNTQSFTDVGGGKDLGNFDIFTETREGYHLEGDWGEVKIASSPVKLEWI